MGFIADIITVLPPPWNIIVTLVLVGLAVLVLIAIVFLVIKLIKNGFSVGPVSVKGGKSESKSVMLSEDNIDVFFNVIIDTVTNAIEKSTSKRVSDKMEFAEGKLGSLYTTYKKEFFKLLEGKGLDKRLITAHDDYVTFDLSLKTALYLQNGIDSFKTILKNELKDGLYRDKTGNEYDDFIKNLGIRFNTIFSKTFEGSYKNSTYYGTSSEPTFRLIVVEEIYKIFEVTWPVIKDEIRAIFDHAKDTDKRIDEWEVEKRKDNIKVITTLLLGSAGDE